MWALTTTNLWSFFRKCSLFIVFVTFVMYLFANLYIISYMHMYQYVYHPVYHHVSKYSGRLCRHLSTLIHLHNIWPSKPEAFHGRLAVLRFHIADLSGEIDREPSWLAGIGWHRLASLSHIDRRNKRPGCCGWQLPHSLQVSNYSICLLLLELRGISIYIYNVM